MYACVVLTGEQPGRQRSTGSTEKHLDSWPSMNICFSSFTDSYFIKHPVKSKMEGDISNLCMKEDNVGATIFTRRIPAAFSRFDPGMSVADCAVGHTSVGHAELLSDFPISLSTEPTGLSLHPVHNLNLEDKHLHICISYFTRLNVELIKMICFTFRALISK